MQRQTQDVDRALDALWRANAGRSPPPLSVPLEVWQANVLRAIRLAADRGRRELEAPWLALQRTAAALVLLAALGWMLVTYFTPATETLLAQEAWLSHSEVVNVEGWAGE